MSMLFFDIELGKKNILKHISYRLLLIGVHFIKHDICTGCIFKMCRNFTYEVVGQRRKLKVILKKCSSWLKYLMARYYS
jgi:hypothetical protein